MTPPSALRCCHQRVEALVTFGNAGGRGGGGSVGNNIDINGNGSIDTDEANVRTVPSRIALAALPASPDQCNDSVTVTDTGATTTGTVSTSNPVGFDAFPALISSSTSWMVSVDVDSGTDGGNVCNEAQLEGAACGGTLPALSLCTETMELKLARFPPCSPLPVAALPSMSLIPRLHCTDDTDNGVGERTRLLRMIVAVATVAR
jgi:hypothetical protein